MKAHKEKFKQDAAKFRGKKYHPDEGKRIFSRLNTLYKDKTPPDTIRAIMQSEGFRRVDGSNLTLSWVNARLKKVVDHNKGKKTRHLSGPVKTIYEKKKSSNAPKGNKTLDTISEITGSNLSDETKLYLVQLLTK
jgi:hypothetical protein